MKTRKTYCLVALTTLLEYCRQAVHGENGKLYICMNKGCAMELRRSVYHLMWTFLPFSQCSVIGIGASNLPSGRAVLDVDLK